MLLPKPPTSSPPAQAQPARQDLTVEGNPKMALSLGQAQVMMAKLDNDPELLRQGQELIAQAQAVLARQSGQAPKG